VERFRRSTSKIPNYRFNCIQLNKGKRKRPFGLSLFVPSSFLVPLGPFPIVPVFLGPFRRVSPAEGRQALGIALAPAVFLAVLVVLEVFRAVLGVVPLTFDVAGEGEGVVLAVDLGQMSDGVLERPALGGALYEGSEFDDLAGHKVRELIGVAGDEVGSHLIASK